MEGGGETERENNPKGVLCIHRIKSFVRQLAAHLPNERNASMNFIYSLLVLLCQCVHCLFFCLCRSLSLYMLRLDACWNRNCDTHVTQKNSCMHACIQCIIASSSIYLCMAIFTISYVIQKHLISILSNLIAQLLFCNFFFSLSRYHIKDIEIDG